METKKLSSKPKRMCFFDEADFMVFEKSKEVKMIGALVASDREEFGVQHKEILKKFKIPKNLEIKWNSNRDVRSQVTEKVYKEYKEEFMALIASSFDGFIGVSQHSKIDALEQILLGAKFKKSEYIFDYDLVEDKQKLPELCGKNPWSFKESSEQSCLQAADFFVGAIKLIIQQNSGIHKRKFLFPTPGYADGEVPAEFILRMQTRYMLSGPINESIDELKLPIKNCIGHSIFLAPDLDPEIETEFREHFANSYMGCWH